MKFAKSQDIADALDRAGIKHGGYVVEGDLLVKAMVELLRETGKFLPTRRRSKIPIQKSHQKLKGMS